MGQDGRDRGRDDRPVRRVLGAAGSPSHPRHRRRAGRSRASCRSRGRRTRRRSGAACATRSSRSVCGGTSRRSSTRQQCPSPPDGAARARIAVPSGANRGARATGLRGRLARRRPAEPDLGNASGGTWWRNRTSSSSQPGPALPSRARRRATVVAADGGLDRARALGLDVDVVIGDLDSVSADALAAAERCGRTRRPAPRGEGRDRPRARARRGTRARRATRARRRERRGPARPPARRRCCCSARSATQALELDALVGEARRARRSAATRSLAGSPGELRHAPRGRRAAPTASRPRASRTPSSARRSSRARAAASRTSSSPTERARDGRRRASLLAIRPGSACVTPASRQSVGKVGLAAAVRVTAAALGCVWRRRRARRPRSCSLTHDSFAVSKDGASARSSGRAGLDASRSSRRATRTRR